MNEKAKRILSLVVKIAVAAALIVFMVKMGHLDPKEIWELMTFRNVSLALITFGLSTYGANWRWVLLLRSRGFNVTLNYGFALYLIGIFFNFALPGSVGGDVVRGYYLVSDFPERRLDAILSIIIDRVLGLYSFFILTLLAVAWDFDFVVHHDKIRWVALMCLLVFLGLTSFFIIAFSHRLSHMFGLGFFERKIPIVHRIVIGIQHYGRDRKLIALSVLASIGTQVITCAFFYQLGVWSGETAISWGAVFFVVPMGFLVTAIPIAPAGIGVGQVAFAYLFQAYLQKATPFGANSITAYQLCAISWAMVGAAIYLSRRKPKELQ